MPERYRGRLAPSPTGLLHLGHARTFLIAAARARGGVLVFRSDDLDTERSRPEFARAMLEDLHWLGLRWDEGPAGDARERGTFGPYRQSRRSGFYEEAFRRLRQAGAVYPCGCSRRELQNAARAPHADDEDEPLYPGTCRPGGFRAAAAGTAVADSAQISSLEPAAPAEEDGTAWRFRVPEGETVRFDDGLLGPQSFRAGVDFGDFVVRRRDGVSSYQLACAVDDAAMRITEVVRGRDLLRSTARQILLLRALELPVPAYAHTELVTDAAGQRLAKRSDALSLRALRESGYSPAEVTALAGI